MGTWLITCCFVAVFQVSWAQNLNHIERLKKSTEGHTDRMQTLPVSYVIENPKEFPECAANIAFVIEWFKLHDIVKRLTLEELHDRGYEHQEDFLTRLAQFYGRREIDLSTEEQARLRGLINEMNSFEETQKANLAMEEEIKFDSELIKEIRILEKAFDVSDVGIFRTEEMGILNAGFFNGAKRLEIEKVAQRVIDFARTAELYIRMKLTPPVAPPVGFCGGVFQ